jgi:multidrug efflux pump subunit AcrA (membrane-fusion protein)
MQSVKTIALWGVLAPCFALVLSGAAFAQPSTPAEQSQTQQLNQNITDTNAAAVAQSDQANAEYQAQQQQYQEQLRLYKANRQNYEERSSRYYAARDRYISSHARYHRYGWPSRYEHSLVVYTAELLGARVQTYNGRTVGRVEELALANGHVDAVRVVLDSGRGDIWIESADLRYDSNRRVVMTNLDRRDLYEMTRITY